MSTHWSIVRRLTGLFNCQNRRNDIGPEKTVEGGERVGRGGERVRGGVYCSVNSSYFTYG